jgi:hypothetical protein
MQRRPRLSLTKLGLYLPCEHSALECRASAFAYGRQGKTDDTISNSTNLASAAHVETCGVHFPRRTSDAYALEHPAASAISESLTPASLGRISRQNSSGS